MRDNRQRKVRIVAVDNRDRDLVPAYSEAFGLCGWELRQVADLRQWVTTQPAALLLVKISHSDDWGRLEQLVRLNPDATVVALLLRSAPSFYRRAFLTGAAGVAAVTDPPAHIARVLQVAISKYALVPVSALREGATTAAARPVITEAHRALLHDLAAGLSTEEIARQENCSERTVYRRLRGLCANLQVGGRDEAIAVARRLGLMNNGVQRSSSIGPRADTRNGSLA